MKKMTQRLRQAKTWLERAKIAEDKVPGTPFDYIFDEAKDAKLCAKLGIRGNQLMHLQNLGVRFAEIILRGDSQTLRKIALALDDWKWHKPKPDHDLVVFCNLMAMFPPGGVRVKLDTKSKRLVRNGVYGRMTVGALVSALNQRFPDHGENRMRYDESIRKKFKRYAAMFNVDLPDERKLKTGHNSAKKV